VKRILLNEGGIFYKINIIYWAELSVTNCRAELSGNRSRLLAFVSRMKEVWVADQFGRWHGIVARRITAKLYS